jgi:hypothetical protein
MLMKFEVPDKLIKLIALTLAHTRAILECVPSGQLSNTVCAMSPAESLGLNRNSFVFPLTRINRRLI